MATAQQTISIYQAVLQRAPTDAELASFVANSQTAESQATQIDLLVNSAEANDFVAPVIRLYQATFGRVPDADGLNFWTDFLRAQAENGTSTFDALTTINAGFVQSTEFSTRFPDAASDGIVDETFLTALYQQTFQRDPSDADKEFYVGKTIAATLSAFAQSSETIGNFDPYTDLFLTKAANGTQDYQQSLLDANDDGEVNQADVDVVNGNATEGTTFTLTTAVDAGPDFTGTAQNDTFNGSLAATVAGVNPSTLNAADSLDGGAGTDTLNITVSGGFNADVINGASVKNIEIVNVRNVSGNDAVAIDAQNVPGATQIWSDRSTADLTITKLATGATAGVRGNGVVQNGDVTFGYSKATDAATLAFDGGTKAGAGTGNGTAAEDAASFSVGLTGAATAATITSTGGANSVNNIALDSDGGGATVKSLTIDAATDLTVSGAEFSNSAVTTLTTWISGLATDATIDVNGAGKVGLGTIEANVKEVNAADNTGGVTVSGGFEATDKFVGGKGNDTLTAGFALTTGSADGGEGTGDRLVVTDDAVVATSALAGKFTNFEILRTAEAGTSTYNLANITGLTAVEVAGSGGTTFNGYTTQTLTVVGDAVGGLTVNKTGALPSGSDTLDIAIDNSVLKNADGVDVGTINAANIDVLNLSSVGANLSSATESNSAAIGGNADLETVNLTGDTAFSLTTSGSTVDSVNASTFTADLTVSAAGNNGAIEILGGSGKNTLTGSSNGDVIKGGAAADTITGGLGADVMTGGGAADKFVFQNYTASTGTGTISNANTTANVDRETITITAGTDNADQTVNILYTLNGVAGQIIGNIDALKGSNVDTSDAAAVATFVAEQLDAKANIDAGAATNVVTASTAGALEITSVTFGGTTPPSGVANNGTDTPQVNTLTIDTDPVVGETYSFTVTPQGGTAVTVSVQAASTDAQSVVTQLISAVNNNAQLNGVVIASDVAAPDEVSFTITDVAPNNGGFTVSNTGTSVVSYAGDTGVSVTGSGATLAVSGFDKITDFNTGGADVLSFGDVLNSGVAGAAATNPIAGSSVQIDGNGKAIFAAGDDTLAEKVAALAADNTNVANNELVFFEDGGNTYVYGAGIDTTNNDADFLVELTGVTGLTKMTELAQNGDFTIA